MVRVLISFWSATLHRVPKISPVLFTGNVGNMIPLRAVGPIWVFHCMFQSSYIYGFALYGFAPIWFRPYMVSPLYGFAPVLFGPVVKSEILG